MIKKVGGLAVSALMASFFVALGIIWAASAGSMRAGVAAAVKGEVKITTPPDTVARSLKSGDEVLRGDKIETGADGHLQILLLDQTVFTLGPLSSINLDEFAYDASNDDGRVRAGMMKGIFRVVSGKIAHKNPENMSVDLPAGSIGFRGTNVAGIIDGKRSLIVLLGPVGAGRIYVTNIVDGKVVGVDIDRAGNATIVEGVNSAPAAVFQVSEADLNRIAEALGQKRNGQGSGTTGVNAGNAASNGRQEDTQALMDLLNTVDSLNQTAMTAAQDKAQDSIKKTKDETHGSGSPGQGGQGSVG